MKFFTSLLFASLLLFAASLRAEKPATEAKDKKEAVAEKKRDKNEGKEKDATEQTFDMPVQEGVPVKGLKIPQYDKDGKLQMMFEAELATKIDATHIEMENLKIDAYSEDGKKFYIELPRAVFNLETRNLDGQDHVLIRREDFEITGDAGEFQIKTRHAKIIGNVKMTIFSTESFDQP